MRGFPSIHDVENVALVDIDGERCDVEPSHLRDQLNRNSNTSPDLAGSDPDAEWEMAELCGDEAAGGSNLTPDQNVVEEFGEAIGLTYEDDEELACGVKSRERDRHRWELDPASAEDWEERKRR
jgi:Family of unknown function (DUF6335)